MTSLWNDYITEEVTYYLDDEEKLFWIIKAPTFSAEAKVARVLRKEKDLTMLDIMMHELVASFGGTNFPHFDSPTNDPDDPEYIPAFNGEPSEAELKAYIQGLPSTIVNEIWRLVPQVAPNWGPNWETFPGRGE